MAEREDSLIVLNEFILLWNVEKDNELRCEALRDGHETPEWNNTSVDQ
ncbi:MAG: hypothetical protein K0B14_15050 [Anaerolineaceae bacterium]|nr:hypothetical protein [Anaerolineaceae bacterium]